MREFAGDNIKFNENDIKFSKRIENTVGKGDIACFFFRHSAFKIPVLQTRKTGLAWERVKQHLKFTECVAG